MSGGAPREGRRRREGVPWLGKGHGMPDEHASDDPTGDGLITLADAAERLAVSVRTVRRLIQYGYLEGYRVGPRAIRVHENDVARVVQRMPPGYGDEP